MVQLSTEDVDEFSEEDDDADESTDVHSPRISLPTPVALPRCSVCHTRMRYIMQGIQASRRAMRCMYATQLAEEKETRREEREEERKRAREKRRRRMQKEKEDEDEESSSDEEDTEEDDESEDESSEEEEEEAEE